MSSPNPGSKSSGGPCLFPTSDPTAALQRLASAYRDRLATSGVAVIAVGGSNGKTTARHLIHTALSARLTGSQSPKSFNNHLGVPLTLLAAKEDDDFVVCEVGSNHPGEVAALAAIVRPDIAVITSIGKEHLEHFGTLEAVEREERSLLDHVRSGGLVLAPPFDGEKLPPAPDPFPLLGEPNRLYARLALAVARDRGVNRAAAAQALARVSGMEGRLQRIDLPGDVTVIHDAYNSNPDSALAALEVLKSESRKPKVQDKRVPPSQAAPCGPSTLDFQPSTPRRAVAILGDMLELGDTALAEHRALGLAAAEVAEVVICIGELSMFTAAAAGTPHGFGAWSDDLPGRVAALIEPRDVVLLKASRGMGLERLLPAIQTHAASCGEASGGAGEGDCGGDS